MQTEKFQTHDGNLNIRPRFNPDTKAALMTLDIPKGDCRWEVLVIGINPSEMQMWNKNPCPLFRSNIQPQRIGYALIKKQKKYHQNKERLSLMKGTWKTITIREQSFWLFSRNSSWFENPKPSP